MIRLFWRNLYQTLKFFRPKIFLFFVLGKKLPAGN